MPAWLARAGVGAGASLLKKYLKEFGKELVGEKRKKFIANAAKQLKDEGKAKSIYPSTLSRTKLRGIHVKKVQLKRFREEKIKRLKEHKASERRKKLKEIDDSLKRGLARLDAKKKGKQGD
tara:strand:+ start:641 stop:1003 length:363 start_codon:yes stop_codon:yes gene_type:complete